MSFLKLNGIVGRTLIALAVLGTSSRTALADTTLLCSWSNSELSNIVLNEGAGSITIYYPPMPNPGGSPNPIPGGLRGTFAAKFSPNEITFVDEEGNPRTLNRSTGILEWYGTPRHPIGSTETCHVVQKQF
jgi:hypothetical protein